MWSISATERSTALAQNIWVIYRDVANWSRWDRGIAKSQLDGNFAIGSAGILQPAGGPELPFSIILVEEGHRFADSTPIGPDNAVIVRHELTQHEGYTQITHVIEIDGPDAEQLAVSFGFSAEDLQETVFALARYAEEQHAD